MSAAKLYGIYTAQFPFLDTSEGKVRPVIVISSPHGQHGVIAIIPVSSKLKRENVDVTLNDWNDAGLVRPSVARVHRQATMLQSDLLSQLGTLGEGDIRDLQISIRTFLRI